MLRFILKCKNGDQTCGRLDWEYLYTLDIDVPALEQALTRGGRSQYGYELHELVGVEVLKKTNESPDNA